MGFFLTVMILAADVNLPDEASRVRVLMVVDHSVPGADLDQMHMKIALRIDKVAIDKEITGDRDLDPKTIMHYYEDLQVDPNETLVFYYVGRSKWDADQGHLLDLGNGLLPRKKLRQAMVRKKPRLVVILTDCSNDRCQMPGRLSSTRLPDLRIAEQLLYRGRGVVDINSSIQGNETSQDGWGSSSNGGVFSNALYFLFIFQRHEELDANKDGLLDWNEFFASLVSQTHNHFQSFKRNCLEHYPEHVRKRLEEQNTQKPCAFALPELTQD